MSWIAAWLRVPSHSDGSVDLRLALHASPAGPVELWSERQPQVQVLADGWAGVVLGAVEPLKPELFDDRPRWLSLRLGAAGPAAPELGPRVPVDGRATVVQRRLSELAQALAAPPAALRPVVDAVAGLRDHVDGLVRALEEDRAGVHALQLQQTALEARLTGLGQELERRADALADVVGPGGELHDHERRIAALEQAAAAADPLPPAASVPTGLPVQGGAPVPRTPAPSALPSVSSVEVPMSVELPPSPWFNRVRDAYLDGAASVFVLHGLVQDVHPIDHADGIQWGSLSESVCARLLPSRDLVLRYDPFYGLRPVGVAARRHLETRPVEPGQLPALSRISRLLSDRRQSTAVVIDHADLLFPSVRPELPDDRLARSALRHWLDDPGLRESNNILFLVAPQRLQLAAELLEHPRVEVIEVGPHAGPTVRAYLRSAHGVDIPLADDVLLDGPLLARFSALSRLARGQGERSPEDWLAALGVALPQSA